MAYLIRGGAKDLDLEHKNVRLELLDSPWTVNQHKADHLAQAETSKSQLERNTRQDIKT
jgi:hypothetical protein